MLILFSCAYWSSGLTRDFFHLDAIGPRSSRSRVPCPCWRRPGLSVKLDQILEDQAAPAIRVRLHKQATFRKPAKFDRRESAISRKRRNLLAGSVIVARQEHDPLAAMDGRILEMGRAHG